VGFKYINTKKMKKKKDSEEEDSEEEEEKKKKHYDINNGICGIERDLLYLILYSICRVDTARLVYFILN
jgi:hypothetical protein